MNGATKAMQSTAKTIAASIVTSAGVRQAQRLAAATVRPFRGGLNIHYFHDVGDPYSHLTVQLLERLASAYGVVVTPHLVSPPDMTAAPETLLLANYAVKDAHLLAAAHGLSFVGEAPMSELTMQMGQAALAGVGQNDFAKAATEIGDLLWRGERPSVGSRDPSAALAAGDALRARLGHYLGATFFFEGEWYWGIDRLPHLERRLASRRQGSAVVRQLEATGNANKGKGGSIDFFLSFRSPYTYLAAARVRQLAEQSGATLRLRFVLPMVMRGLPVPAAKRLYIVRDAKREAERQGMPFGRIADPVGAGAERGLAVLHHAIGDGRGNAFAESFLKGVFADGIDAATDKGLAAIAERAGIGASVVFAALADSSWRAVAEANRAELFSLGLWGVPSFRVNNGRALWGQDRLWAVENELKDSPQANNKAESSVVFPSVE